MEKEIRETLQSYYSSFTKKTYSDENNEYDILMELFGISPDLKRENRQYWGRELGMLWQRVIIEIFKEKHPHFGDALKYDADEPCDLVAGSDAIDTKYRIGSGDSGTLKKFKTYGKLLRDEGYRPVLLILREDNLPAAIKACEVGGWTILTGQKTYEYIREKTGVDIVSYLKKFGNEFAINR
ncbi:hypothetical protein [Robertmurraya massiliosenegalensis]|uniref:hypothetical protein n=1 Tax=Robertmurraya massiliosenegalensis TaxID=1287657 RepID=UPI0002D299EA|nr:hypothetical protein [Robertmurraya massiliosenegalensis]